MAATQFAVVYGTVSKVIRRIIEPGQENVDDSHIALAQGNLASGESLIALNLADFPISRARADVQPQIGTPVHSGRCAVIDTSVVPNIVRQIIQADPLIDTVAGLQLLVQTDLAGIGWTYQAGVFTAPPVVTPSSGSVIGS